MGREAREVREVRGMREVRQVWGTREVRGTSEVVWVRVEDDHRVRRRQVDPHAAGARPQQEDERLRVVGAEAIDGVLPLVAGDRAVEPLVALRALRKGES